MGKILEKAPASPFVYNRLKARDRQSHLIRSKESRVDTPTAELTLNGQILQNVTSSRAEEMPERFTRSSGIRPMHQSGWSFSGGKKTVKNSIMQFYSQSV